jgi:hypothetical protein
MSPATQQPDKVDQPTAPAKPEVMGIERDDNNARLSFTQDGNLMIITIPIGKMSPIGVHGYLWELHKIADGWYAERKAMREKLSLNNRDAASRFSFKQGVSKLLGR